MLFNSYIFILFFLPITLLGYFILNKYAYGKKGMPGLIWLFFMSLWFYGYEKPVYLVLILASIAINYGISRCICNLKKQKAEKRAQKSVVFLGILFNLGILFYFKYADFFVDSIEGFFHAEWNVEVALPLGISFFTFQQISYVVDCYKEKEGVDYNFFEYAAYVTFFPQLVAGPIVMHSELVPQLRSREKKQINYENLSRGLYAFALGLAKKVLIADSLSRIVNVGFSNIHFINQMNSMTAILVMLCYTLQIYFDFSGYCDMAVGMAWMFNVKLPFNFNSPYKAKSIGEFWDRWHMTLTRFFTHYVYIPLGGNRKGKIRTYCNTLIVFLLSGLWHGADWTFVLWGFLHGIMLTVEKTGKDLGLQLKEIPEATRKIVNVIKTAVTFGVINVTWILFRSESIEYAGNYIRRIFAGGWELNREVTEVFEGFIEIRLLGRLGFNSFFGSYPATGLAGILVILLTAVFFMKNTQEKMMKDKYNIWRSLVTMILIVWCVVSLSDVSEFLYFNF